MRCSRACSTMLRLRSLRHVKWEDLQFISDLAVAHLCRNSPGVTELGLHACGGLTDKMLTPGGYLSNAFVRKDDYYESAWPNNCCSTDDCFESAWPKNGRSKIQTKRSSIAPDPRALSYTWLHVGCTIVKA